MKIYLYPPTPISVTVPLPAGSATEATLERVADNQYLSLLGYALLDFSADPVDELAWTEVTPSVGGAQVYKAQIFMSSGEPLEIGLGAPGSEVVRGCVLPGGNGVIDFKVASGTRVSVRAINSVTIDSGNLIINFLG